MQDEIHEVIAKTRAVLNVNINEKNNCIAFNWNKEGKWDVYIYSLSSKLLSRITTGKDSYLEPFLSHNGKSILYLMDHEGDENYQVILRDLSTNEEKNLTNDSSHYYNSPKFSLNDEKIAMLSNKEGKPSQLYLFENGVIKELTGWSDPIFSFDWLSNDEILYVKGIYDTEIRLFNLNNYTDVILLKFEKSETFLGGVDIGRRKFLFTSNSDEYFDVGEYDVDKRSWRWIYKSKHEKFLPKYAGNSITFIEFEDGKNILKRLCSGLSSVAEGVSEYEIMGKQLVYVKNTSYKPNSLFLGELELIDNTPECLKGELINAESTYYESFDGR